MKWHDLSSAELRARLVQRGMHPTTAARVVQRRDHPDGQAVLQQWLGRR